MKDYQTHPSGTYGIETRDGDGTVDSYIARARGFNSVDAWREYRDSSPHWKATMRRDRNRDNTSAEDDGIRRRTLELLKANS